MNTWYRQEAGKWVLYLSGERLAEYDSRRQLLQATSNHNQRPVWRPHWYAPYRARVTGTPRRSPIL